MAEQQINVAQQDTLEAIDNKIDTLDTVADNIYAKVDSEVAAIKTKTDTIGATGDTGGSATAGTVMGKLNKIISDIATFVGNWTATRAGYIDTIKTNTDRLTSARATKIDNIGATGDTGGSATAGTIMGKLNGIFTNAANSVTYTKTNNTASKTGVLSQKDSYIISLLENGTYGLNAIKTAASNSGGGNKRVVSYTTHTVSRVVTDACAGTYGPSIVQGTGRGKIILGGHSNSSTFSVKIDNGTQFSVKGSQIYGGGTGYPQDACFDFESSYYVSYQSNYWATVTVILYG